MPTQHPTVYIQHSNVYTKNIYVYHSALGPFYNVQVIAVTNQKPPHLQDNADLFQQFKQLDIEDIRPSKKLKCFVFLIVFQEKT